MHVNKKKFVKIVLLIFCFFEMINCEMINAQNIGIDGNYSSSAAGGVASGGGNGVWQVAPQNIEFRVTLVDSDGKKVDNTKSIDYGYNGGVNNNTVKEANNINRGYKYKYGDNNGNYDSYRLNLVNTVYSYYGYTNFINEYKQIIKNRTKKFGIENGSTGKYDFLTMFLYHCGYLSHNSGEPYYDIDDAHWKEKKIDISEKKYFLLIEPIYSFNLYGTIHRGTAKELANYLLSLGYIPYNLMSAFTYTMGMGMRTTVSEAKAIKFKRIKKDNVYFVSSGASNNKVYEEWNAIANDDYGNGIGVLSITAMISTPELENIDVNVKMDYCPTEETGDNNGIVKFEIVKGFTTYENFQNLVNAGYKLKKYNSANSQIYCYDDVTYDFSEIIETLNKLEFKVHSYIQIPKGTVTVNRHCAVYSPSVEYDTAKTTFLNMFNEYENQYILLNLFNKSIYINKINTDIHIDESKLNNIIGKKRGIYNTTATITFGYNENNSKLYIGKNAADASAYIDLSNVTYGYSNDLKKQLTDKAVFKYDKYIFTTHVDSGSENYTCAFKTDVTDISSNDMIKFRTISLNNPFPSRDASSRLPGSNWLGADNYVRTYINHNRGVNGSEVYNKEPIYTITLTPSQMIKIREYNKKHNYSDLDLNCVGENNTSCLSNFLRTTIDKKNITGSCMINSDNIISDPNGIAKFDKDNLVNKINSIKEESTLNHFYTSEELNMDFNKDGLLTLRDAYIYDNASKTTNYYTCADKTYENSGYIKEVSNNE